MRKKKKVLPALAKNLKQVSSTLQSQANDIVADVYVEELKTKVDFTLPPIPEKPFNHKMLIPEPPESILTGYSFRRDYTVMLDCLAAVAFAGGFTCIGYAIRMHFA